MAAAVPYIVSSCTEAQAARAVQALFPCVQGGPPGSRGQELRLGMDHCAIDRLRSGGGTGGFVRFADVNECVPGWCRLVKREAVVMEAGGLSCRSIDKKLKGASGRRARDLGQGGC